MYSNNILFMDGEFSKLTTKGIEFVSIALIKPTGEELYLELETEQEPDTWVIENVLPHLKYIVYTKRQAIEKIRAFVGKTKPFLIADVNQFDWNGICNLFGVWEQPFHYIPIDFATILFQKGIDPDIERKELCEKMGIETKNFQKHNALEDTRILKQLYEKIRKEVI